MKLKNLLLFAIVIMANPELRATAVRLNRSTISDAKCDIAEAASYKKLFHVCSPHEQPEVRLSSIVTNSLDDKECLAQLNTLFANLEVDLDGPLAASAFNLVVKNTFTQSVDFLIRNGANMYWEETIANEIDKNLLGMRTPIGNAIMDGHFETVETFFKHGFNANHIFSNQMTLMNFLGIGVHRAAIPALRQNKKPELENKYKVILDLLISHRIHIDESHLNHAISIRHRAFAQALFERGVNVTKESVELAQNNARTDPGIEWSMFAIKLAERAKKQMTDHSWLAYGCAALACVAGIFRCARKPKKENEDNSGQQAKTHAGRKLRK